MGIEIKYENNVSAILSQLEGSALPRALERIGSQAEGYAKDLCPVDTSRLQNSISYQVDNTTLYVGTKSSLVMGENVEYGIYVELGTYKMAAQPFLKPAMADHAATYKNIIESEMQ